MRLNTRVSLIALAFCLVFSTSLAGILLVNGFQSELNSELDRGVNTSGMLSGTLSAAMEAFSSLADGERVARAVRVAVRYMPSAGLVAVADGKGALIHDNFPLDKSQLLGFMPETPGRYLITHFEDGVYQLIRRDFYVLDQRFTLFSAWDLGQVFAGAQAQATTAALVIGVMGLLLWALLSLALRAAFQPLRRLEQAAMRIGGGDYGARAPKAPRPDEVGQLSQAFNQMAGATQEHVERLTRQDRAQKQFIADMAHELKTPITSMVGYADLIRRSPMDESRQQQALSAIVSQGERLERMGAKLMQLSRLSREEAPTMAWHKAEALFTPALEALNSQVRDKEIQLTVTGSDTAFYGDSDLLITLIQNLLSNAIKASNPGGSMLLRASPSQIIVQDEGAGIAPEHLPHLTEAFYMADKSRARSAQGNGLGLALVSRIARLHGASLAFESAVGQGTTVRVSFTTPIHP